MKIPPVHPVLNPVWQAKKQTPLPHNKKPHKEDARTFTEELKQEGILI